MNDLLLPAAAIVLAVTVVVVSIRQNRRLRESPKPPSSSLFARIGHGLAALGMSLLVAFIFVSLTAMQSIELVRWGCPTLGLLLQFSPLIIWVFSFIVFLPRSNNESNVEIIRYVGRYSMSLRYFIVAAFGIALVFSITWLAELLRN